ncbi:DUF533 domain-containing protein [Dokdonella sp.]|uniref:DUF533 domain-containing protein n=1 Tax=Dokdonella sp. TaxID=2291710 RepID=UPI0025BF4267|nr:DUF533 domain-containing protein [Dokdonella sp.]MBX3692178.1 hypothetical protein [Dokdonella sp.]
MTSPLPPSIELHHLQSIVRAMHAVAESDGVHATEQVMLRGFYESCQHEAGALASFDDIVATPFDAATDAAAFDTPERKAVLLQSCLLLAHADGRYSTGERACIASFAQALGVDASTLGAIEEGIADHLLQQISRISNVDALRQVADELAAK